jgi:membrane-associated phospholipid phosphatase
MTAKPRQPGLLAYLFEDLRGDLVAGASRSPAVSPGGAAWLGRWAMVAALIGLTLFLLCGYQAGFGRVNGPAAHAAPWVWQWLTMLGDERVAFALTLFFSRRYPRVFWALILAALLASAYTHALKPLFSALRPPAVLEPGSFRLIGPAHRKASFPSGHTVTAAVFFGVWVYYLRGLGLRWLMVALAVLAGLSRVALGVHWPVDVAGGMAGGVLSAWAGAALARRAPWGVLDPWVHLAFVTLAAFFAVALLLWDGGYPQAARLQAALGVAALGSAVVLYLAWPVIRWARSAGQAPCDVDACGRQESP